MKNYKVIDNVCIYGLEESILASGYPMATETEYGRDLSEQDYKRATVLGRAKSGSGHDCYLKGITVHFDVTLPQYIWQQMQRYHFVDFVSSQSKMHRLVQMDIKKQCNEFVDQEIIEYLEKLIKQYNEEKSDELFNRIVSNTPMGLTLTARLTTNYLQLKTIYYQRRNHKMPEWREFCNEIENFPHFKEFVLKENNE